MCSVAQTAVPWLPTRTSGVQFPQMLVGANGVFWHLNSKSIMADWPRKLQSYQQCIVVFFPPTPTQDWVNMLQLANTDPASTDPGMELHSFYTID